MINNYFVIINIDTQYFCFLKMCSTRLNEEQSDWSSQQTVKTSDQQDSDEEGSVELECRENMDENEEAFDSSDEEDIERRVFPQQRVSPCGFARRSLTPDVGKIKYSPIPFTRRARTPEVSSSLGTGLQAKTKSSYQRQIHTLVEPTFRTPKVDDKTAEMDTFARPLPAPSVKSSSPGLTISGSFTPKGSVFRPKRHLTKTADINQASTYSVIKPVHPSFQHPRVVAETLQQHMVDSLNTGHHDSAPLPNPPQTSLTLKSHLKPIAPLPFIRGPKAGTPKHYVASSALQGIAQQLPSPKEVRPVMLPKVSCSEGGVMMSSFGSTSPSPVGVTGVQLFKPLLSPPLVSPSSLAVTTSTFHFSSPVISLGVGKSTSQASPVVSPRADSMKCVPHVVSPGRTIEGLVAQPWKKMESDHPMLTESCSSKSDGEGEHGGDKNETILKRFVNDGMEA